MAFKAIKGRWGLRWYPKKASTAFAKDSLVQFDGSGAVEPSTSTSDDNVGIIRKAIAATDSDYASTTKVPIEVPLSPYSEMEGDVSTGTLAASSVGSYFDLTDASGVNQSSGANTAVLCTGYISASKGRFILNATAANKQAA